jgi:hypothetical protein
VSFSRLARRLNTVSFRLTRGIESLVENIVTDVGREVVSSTPVKTGFARGNWRPTLNAPSPVPVSALDPTGAATIARIASVGAQYRVGNTVFIRNNASYIGLLNAGSSPQAPPGFVGAAVTRGVQSGIARSAGTVRL